MSKMIGLRVASGIVLVVTVNAVVVAVEVETVAIQVSTRILCHRS